MYAQHLEGDSWRDAKMDKAKIDKMSGSLPPAASHPPRADSALQTSRLPSCTSSCWQFASKTLMRTNGLAPSACQNATPCAGLSANAMLMLCSRRKDNLFDHFVSASPLPAAISHRHVSNQPLPILLLRTLLAAACPEVQARPRSYLLPISGQHREHGQPPASPPPAARYARLSQVCLR